MTSGGARSATLRKVPFQGLAALLVTPPFAAAAVHGVLPVPTPRPQHCTPSTSG